jgi:hypothetical protein
MEAIMLKSGKIVKGKLADILVKAKVAIYLDEEVEEEVHEIVSHTAFEQKPSVKKVVKKTGKPKGRPTKVKK